MVLRRFLASSSPLLGLPAFLFLTCEGAAVAKDKLDKDNDKDKNKDKNKDDVWIVWILTIPRGITDLSAIIVWSKGV